MYDLVFRNATIVDGSGAPGFRADLAVSGDTIASVGGEAAPGRRVIDAEGLVLSPGFIDMHTHADMGALSLPAMPNFISQGVTTVVTGNCGLTLAPCNQEHLEELRQYLQPFLPADLPAFEWRSFGDFLERVEAASPALNVVPLVGHGSIRIAVAGFENRACSRPEIEAMCGLLAQSLEEGCHGLSTGLFYPPGSYADRAELDALFEVLAQYDAMYATHLRSEGRYLEESVREAIALGERHGVRVELSHHKASPRPFWGKVRTTLDMAAAARGRGRDAGVDAYPYDASCTTVTALLPPEALEGGVSAMLGRIADRATREALVRTMVDGSSGKDLFILDVGWDSIFLISCPSNRGLEGSPLAKLVGDPPLERQMDRFLQWLAEIKGDALIGARSISEDDIEAILLEPESIVASDAWVEDPSGRGKCHPRAFGTFPRFIGRYALERGLLSLEDAVRRVTSLPASRLRLKDRGLVRRGMKADLALFDPERFIDRATYLDPKLPPQGLRYVLVNGIMALEESGLTTRREGRVIRRSRTQGGAHLADPVEIL